MKTPMQKTAEMPTDFWNDSCDLQELRESLEHGAVGATSNPVIVATVIKNGSEQWNPVIDQLIAADPVATEDNIAWRLTEVLGRQAAELLLPEFTRSRGIRGRLSLQVNPKFFRDADAMLRQAKELNRIAPNIAVKMPVVSAGLNAIEEATASGIVVTPTVCFSVAQVVAAGEAIERGLDRARIAGVKTDAMRPNVALMVGRLDDHLKRVTQQERISVDPDCLEWAGVAVFKRAYRIFKERGFRSVMLAAAYRNHMHWSEFIGGDVTLSIPYAWWQRFNSSEIAVENRINVPVKPEMIGLLEDHFPDFRRAYEPDGMVPEEFLSFGASVHTLKQFLGSYHDLLALIRERMIR